MTNLRGRIKTLENQAERRMAERYADGLGIDADELLARARETNAQYTRLLRTGLSQRDAWQQVMEPVAVGCGMTLAELKAAALRHQERASDGGWISLDPR